jgi:hypothetical protein
MRAPKAHGLVLGFWWYGSLGVSARISGERMERDRVAIRCEKSADASGKAERPPLLFPIERQPRVVHELSGCELRRLVAVEDRADKFGGQ